VPNAACPCTSRSPSRCGGASPRETWPPRTVSPRSGTRRSAGMLPRTAGEPTSSWPRRPDRGLRRGRHEGAARRTAPPGGLSGLGLARQPSGIVPARGDWARPRPSQVEAALAMAVARWSDLPASLPRRRRPGAAKASASPGATTWPLRSWEARCPLGCSSPSSLWQLGGLIALARGDADVAGTHLWDAATDTYNVPFVARLLPAGESCSSPWPSAAWD